MVFLRLTMVVHGRPWSVSSGVSEFYNVVTCFGGATNSLSHVLNAYVAEAMLTGQQTLPNQSLTK